MTNSSHDSHQVQLRIGHLLSARQARFILVTCALAGIAAAWAWAGRLATLATVVLFILGTLVLELGIGLTRTTRKASRERLAAASKLAAVTLEVRDRLADLEKTTTNQTNHNEATINRIRQLEKTTTNQTNHNEATINRIRQLEKTTTNQTNHNEATINRIRQLVERVDKFDRAIMELTAEIDRRANHETSERCLAFARRAAQDAPTPANILLIISLHRSGSTLLYDIVRTHPATMIEPLARTWTEMGLTGRRYPAAFSNTPTADLAIEASLGMGAFIPSLPRFAGNLPAVAASWSVEKAHPQFYEFDGSTFATLLEAFEKASPGRRVFTAFGLRQPLNAMWSMVEYKQRDPRWYAFLSEADIPAFVLQSLEAMQELALLRPGHVVDIDQLKPGHGPLRSIGRQLSDDSTDDTALDEWVKNAISLTKREDRVESENSGFLGPPDSRRHPDGPGGAWQSQADVLAAADRVYAAILG